MSCWVHIELRKAGVTQMLLCAEYQRAAAERNDGTRPYQYSQTHASFALGTLQHGEAEGPAQELGPRSVGATTSGLVVLRGIERQRDGRLGSDARRQLARRREDSRVAHGMELWWRHGRREPTEEGQRVQVDGDSARRAPQVVAVERVSEKCLRQGRNRAKALKACVRGWPHSC